jgi:hypothetical protein
MEPTALITCSVIAASIGRPGAGGNAGQCSYFDDPPGVLRGLWPGSSLHDCLAPGARISTTLPLDIQNQKES